MDLRDEDDARDGMHDAHDTPGDATPTLAPAKRVDDVSEDGCCAITRAGAPCRNRSKATHPEHGPLCGVHMRSALRQVECAICMCAVRAPTRKSLGCGHTFHRRCIKKWFSRGSLTCPMCRATCLEELASGNQRISARLRHVLRLLPCPANVCFPAYIALLLNADELRRAVGISPQEHQLLVEITFQSFTQEHFFHHLVMLGM